PSCAQVIEGELLELPRREVAEHGHRGAALRQDRLGDLHVALAGALASQLPVRALEPDPEHIAAAIDPTRQPTRLHATWSPFRFCFTTCCLSHSSKSARRKRTG